MKKKLIFGFSIAANLFIALPAMIILLRSSIIQYDLYQTILAPRLGKPEIVFIGDSLTLNGGIWGYRIGRYDFSVWNYGQGGFTTSQVVHYAKKITKIESVKYVFVMAGINDPDKTTDGAKKSFEDYKKIIETIVKAGKTPIIQLTLYRENEESPVFIDNLNQMLSDYAQNHRIHTINLNRILAPKKSLLPEYTTDGVHLNQSAYKIWENEIKASLFLASQ
jgi:lysophospholipase L1-like esterase